MSQIPHWQVWGVLELDKQRNQLQVSLAWRAKKQLPTLEKKLQALEASATAVGESL
jgi:hypothetical protein